MISYSVSLTLKCQGVTAFVLVSDISMNIMHKVIAHPEVSLILFLILLLFFHGDSRRVTYFTDLEKNEYYSKTCSEIASFQKLKTKQEITPDTLC